VAEMTPDIIDRADEVVDAAPPTALAPLTPLERIKAGLEAVTAEAAQLDLSPTAIATTAGDEAVRTFRRKCVRLRTAADEAYETLNRPMLDMQRRARALLADIKTAIEAVEGPADAAIKVAEAAAEQRRLARLEEQRKRIAALRERIDSIAGIARRAVGKTSADITAKIQLAVALDIGDDFGDLKAEAERVRTDTLTSLRELLVATAESEAQAERAQAERERVARLAEFHTRLHNLRSMSIGLGARPAQTIEAALAAALVLEIDDDFWQEFVEQAREARRAVVVELEQMLAEAIARDLLAAEQAAERDRLARQRVEQEQQEAQARAARELADRQAADARAEADRVAAEQRDVEQRRLDAEREQLNADRAAQDEKALQDARRAALGRVSRETVDTCMLRFGTEMSARANEVDACIAALNALQPEPQHVAEAPEPAAIGPASQATAEAPGDEAAVAAPPAQAGPSAAGAPVDDGRRLKLGDLCQRLGFTVDRPFIEGTCGVLPAGTQKRAVLFRACDWSAICDAISAHVQRAKEHHS
jgi:hypothetical protein